MADTEYTGGNTTGFASPAGDYLESRIDLVDTLDLRRPSRYPVRIEGDALLSQGVISGDILIVDTALEPVHGKIAVVMLEERTLAGRLAYRHGGWWLHSGQSNTEPVRIEGDEAEIWGLAVALVRPEL